MARFNFNKPTADYTDDELRKMPKFKTIRNNLHGIKEEEVFRLMLRDIEARREKYFAKMLQSKTRSFVEFLNKRGFIGQEWAIELADDGSYSLIPLRDYVSPDAPIVTVQPETPKKVIYGSAGRKITRNYASDDDNYSGPATMSNIMEAAKKKGREAAKKREEAVAPLGSPTEETVQKPFGSPTELSGFLQSGSTGAIACPDLECSGLMNKAGKVQGTKGLVAWYCEECNAHYVCMKPPGKSEHYITLEDFLKWRLLTKIKEAKQAKKRSEKETETRKWELVTWEQIETWRREHHLSKKRVAKLAGVAKQSFYEWGQGARIPSLANQLKLKTLISQPPVRTPPRKKWEPVEAASE